MPRPQPYKDELGRSLKRVALSLFLQRSLWGSYIGVLHGSSNSTPIRFGICSWWLRVIVSEVVPKRLGARLRIATINYCSKGRLGVSSSAFGTLRQMLYECCSIFVTIIPSLASTKHQVWVCCGVAFSLFRWARNATARNIHTLRVATGPRHSLPQPPSCPLSSERSRVSCALRNTIIGSHITH